MKKLVGDFWVNLHHFIITRSNHQVHALVSNLSNHLTFDHNLAFLNRINYM